jgi:hypothetical protein
MWETKFHTHTKQQVRDKTGRQKIVNYMVASIPQVQSALHFLYECNFDLFVNVILKYLNFYNY